MNSILKCPYCNRIFNKNRYRKAKTALRVHLRQCPKNPNKKPYKPTSREIKAAKKTIKIIIENNMHRFKTKYFKHTNISTGEIIRAIKAMKYYHILGEGHRGKYPINKTKMIYFIKNNGGNKMIEEKIEKILDAIKQAYPNGIELRDLAFKVNMLPDMIIALLNTHKEEFRDIEVYEKQGMHYLRLQK